VQLGVLFMQMAPIALSLAVVDLMVAAIRWPGVLLIAACAAALFSAIRSSAVALLLSRRAPLACMRAFRAAACMSTCLAAVAPLRCLRCMHACLHACVLGEPHAGHRHSLLP
jgi:hypothetical protein